MGKLAAFTEDRARQMSFENLAARIAQAEAELAEDLGSNGHLEPGDLVSHTDCSDFRGRVVATENGTAKVKVLAWRGRVPTWPVTIPMQKLEV